MNRFLRIGGFRISVNFHILHKSCGCDRILCNKKTIGSELRMADPDPKSAAPSDSSLGVDDPITRRDFLGSTLMVSGATLLSGLKPADLLASTTTDEFTGYGGVGEYSHSNGNTLAVMQAGHTIRDGVYNSLPNNITDTEEQFNTMFAKYGFDAQKDIAGIILNRLGSRVSKPPARILFRQRWPACATRDSAPCAIRPGCICQHRSRRRRRSPLLHPRSATSPKSAAGSGSGDVGVWRENCAPSGRIMRES